MSDYGVTSAGFVVKGLDVLLGEAFERARDAFGRDVDLTPTSPLRKIIEVTVLEDAEIWKRIEDSYYAGFVSTAVGDSLDLLGEDVGIVRREAFATGSVTLTLSSGLPGREYVVGDATVIVSTAVPSLAFTTEGVVTLTAAVPTAEVTVGCLIRGSVGNVLAGDLTTIDPVQLAARFSDYAPATLAVTNAVTLTGGGTPEADDVYRGRLLGTSRTWWTLESVQQAVFGVDGVVDVMVSDPLGGVDVTQSYFNAFDFGQRLFSAERRLGEVYTFDVVVAHEYRWPWETTGAVPGVVERVRAALDLVRPPGIHPSIIEADHIDIGLRATVVVEPGYDQAALLARIMDRIGTEAAALRLGNDVLSSQVMRAFTDEPGVIDVQGLHLRRGPAVLGRITLGGVAYLSVPVEAAIGENLAMSPTELAMFRPDSGLTVIEVVTP
ncbi:baseplate J/gp47 family protein [Arthrobacter sp. H41]|uniref:baseplate J/gp47 family protein n=1 Tax=Arthrobacter sp. H41 TaxID=1312978 RepID=UPI00047AA1E4|nr:baseplate J/gp47 family protein [Arthrobacter sp. H41]